MTAFVRDNSIFWRELLPDTTEVVRDINQLHRASPIVVAARPENAALAGAIATAADYFVGWHLRDPLVHVFIRAGSSVGGRAVLSRFLFLLLSRLRDAHPSSRAIPTDHELLLFDALLILAQMDAAYRSLFATFEFDFSGLTRLDPTHSSLQQIAAWVQTRVPRQAALEALQLGHSLVETLPLRGRSRYNPEFDGYGPISTSDADLIAGRTLIEIKCIGTPRRGFRAQDLRQLIGYCMLNAMIGSPYRITSVALVNPRRHFLWRSNPEQLARRMGGGSLSKLVRAAQRTFRPHIKRQEAMAKFLAGWSWKRAV